MVDENVQQAYPPQVQPVQPIQPQYPPPQTTTPLISALDWLLDNPSIPLELKRQFYVMWEIVVFGNYTEKDIKFLLSKFREWCILIKWYIPEQDWNKKKTFIDEQGKEILEVDLNILLNILEQVYYIQLTRGREGFTIKEMTTMRTYQKYAEELEKEIKKSRWI